MMSRYIESDVDLDTQMTPEDYEAVKPYAVVIE
jgi:hypothetical protein